MDFKKAMKAETIEKRNRLIENEIASESFAELLAEDMRHGGWPKHEWVEEVRIAEDKENHLLSVAIDLSFSESIPTSCAEVNLSTPGSATVTLDIYPDGEYDVAEKEVDVQCYGEPDDDDDFSGPADDFL
jgi:hypothetical protein